MFGSAPIVVTAAALPRAEREGGRGVMGESGAAGSSHVICAHVVRLREMISVFGSEKCLIVTHGPAEVSSVCTD